MLWLCHELWYSCGLREILRARAGHCPLHELVAMPQRKLHGHLLEYGLPVLHVLKWAAPAAPKAVQLSRGAQRHSPLTLRHDEWLRGREPLRTPTRRPDPSRPVDKRPGRSSLTMNI